MNFESAQRAFEYRHPSLLKASARFALVLTALGCGSNTRSASGHSDTVIERLGAPLWTASEPFDDISGLRALSNGQVVVSDFRSRQVWLLGRSGERIEMIGRHGAGPGEYRAPGLIIALPSDSSLIRDRRLRRFLQLGPRGQPVAVLGYPEGSGNGPSLARASDGTGRILFPASGMGTPAQPMVPLLAWDRSSGDIDTLAWLTMPIPKQMGSKDSRVSVVSRFAPQDAWAPLPRGALLIVRAKDYSFEIIQPNGDRAVVPHENVSPVEITDEDRELEVKELKGSLPKFRQPFSTFLIWNDAGEVWIPRVVPGDSGRLYDIVDARGTIRGQVRLQPQQRVVGLTGALVYIARTDEDGFEWLSAYQHW